MRHANSLRSICKSPKSTCNIVILILPDAPASAREIAERVDVNQFWRIFLNALVNGAFGRTPEEVGRMLKLVVSKSGKPKLSERQLKDEAENPRCAWTSYYLCFLPGAVIDAMQKYLRSQGQDLPLDRGDLRAQMQARSYFVPGPRQG